MMHRNSKPLRGFILSCCVTAVIFSFLIKSVDTAQLLVLLNGIKIKILLTAVLLSFLTNIIVSSYKLKGILKMVGFVSNMRTVLFLKLGSGPLVAFFPFRTGELSKVAYLNTIHSLPVHKGIVAIAVDLGGNFIALLLILVIGTALYLLHLDPWTTSFLAVAMLLSVVFLNIIFHKGTFLKGSEYTINKYSPGTWKRTIDDFLANFRRMGPLDTFFVLGLSSIQLFGELLILLLLANALSIVLPLKAVFFYFSLINLITRLPVGIQGIGTREAAIIIFFSAFAEKAELLSLGVIYSFVEYILPALFGFILLPFFVKQISGSLLKGSGRA